MFCDGANYGCSFKVSTTAVEAYYSAILALNHSMVDASVGIVSESMAQTLQHVAELFIESNRLDPSILKMISSD